MPQFIKNNKWMTEFPIHVFQAILQHIKILVNSE